MKQDQDICYQALKSRDARFDGRFFTGVTSTGIFCRPVCPATTPKRENCTFFETAAAALLAGFRPCLRCRPESAPASAAWAGTGATINRALRLIEEGALDEGGNLEGLCDRLGVGERHLRRLFQEQLGTSPKQVAQTRRLMFAKKLLRETRISVSEIALASGFSSLRRFNDAYKKAFAIPPTTERQKEEERAAVPRLVLHFNYRPPYDWEGLITFFAGRTIEPVEWVKNNTYGRNIEIDGQLAQIVVSNEADKNRLRAEITGADVSQLRALSIKIRRLFDLDGDPAAIERDLGRAPLMRDLITRYPGLRLPGAWDGFEIAVRAVIGQQISVKGARTICRRVIERIGKPVFATPEDIINTDLDGLGLTTRRIATLKNLATHWQDLDPAKPLEETIEYLCSLSGIGPWSAHYIVMRAFGEPDIYPVQDLGLIRGLEKSGYPAGKKEMADYFDSLRPWRAYGALYLWKLME